MIMDEISAKPNLSVAFDEMYTPTGEVRAHHQLIILFF